MSLTECYQVSDVALPQKSVYSNHVAPPIIDNFHFIFHSTFFPLNVFFIWEAFFLDCSFSSGNNNKNKGSLRRSLHSFNSPLIHSCLLYFTFLSIPYNTGIKMVMGERVNACTFSFMRCWHGICWRFVIFNECNLYKMKNLCFFLLCLQFSSNEKHSTSGSGKYILPRKFWSISLTHLMLLKGF